MRHPCAEPPVFESVQSFPYLGLHVASGRAARYAAFCLLRFARHGRLIRSGATSCLMRASARAGESSPACFGGLASKRESFARMCLADTTWVRSKARLVRFCRLDSRLWRFSWMFFNFFENYCKSHSKNYIWPVTNYTIQGCKNSYRYLYNIWAFYRDLFLIMGFSIKKFPNFLIKFYRNSRSKLI